MRLWPFGKKQERKYARNPHVGRVAERNFTAAQANRFLEGWGTDSNSINYYLRTDLPGLRARSRDQVRNNPYAKRFSRVMRSNIVGPAGVKVQAQIVRNGNLDTFANDEIERHFAQWCNFHCDRRGRSSFVDLQSQAIASAVTDGEFLFRKHMAVGLYGYQLELLDPATLDHTKNHVLPNGNQVVLGVEIDGAGMPVRYHFRKMDALGQTYYAGEQFSVAATEIIHGFLPEWACQVRGVPWMHASLQRMKNLDGYDDAAMIASRMGASQMGFFQNEEGGGFPGDEDENDDGGLRFDVEPGTFRELPPGWTLNKFDPRYPHEQYADFVKSTLRGMSAGLDLSYASLSNDLEGVNYSSIRAGVLEDREIFKQLQDWFVRCFVREAYEDWVDYGIMRGAITIGGKRPASKTVNYLAAAYQPRRWSWVDPQKDMAANEMAVKLKLKSRGQIIREQGDDPDSVWRDIEREESRIGPYEPKPEAPNNAGNEPQQDE